MFDHLLRELRNMQGISEISIELEIDDKGYLDRACPSKECGASFKVYYEDWKAVDPMKPSIAHGADPWLWFPNGPLPINRSTCGTRHATTCGGELVTPWSATSAVSTPAKIATVSSLCGCPIVPGADPCYCRPALPKL